MITSLSNVRKSFLEIHKIILKRKIRKFLATQTYAYNRQFIRYKNNILFLMTTSTKIIIIISNDK
jgi:hypothetical protein